MRLSAVSLPRGLQTPLEKGNILIWGKDRSHLEPHLLTDMVPKLENFVSKILLKVACKCNAVCSLGSFDAVSAGSSHASDMLSLAWMAPCSVPSKRSSHLSLGPGPHAGTGGP